MDFIVFEYLGVPYKSGKPRDETLFRQEPIIPYSSDLHLPPSVIAAIADGKPFKYTDRKGVDREVETMWVFTTDGLHWRVKGAQGNAKPGYWTTADKAELVDGMGCFQDCTAYTCQAPACGDPDPWINEKTL